MEGWTPAAGRQGVSGGEGEEPSPPASLQVALQAVGASVSSAASEAAASARV